MVKRKKQYEYKGKPLTEKETDEFLKRTYLKPKKVYKISSTTGKFVEVKRKKK